MNNWRIMTVCMMCVLAVCLQTASASTAPSAEMEDRGFPDIRETSEGEVIVRDSIHKFKLRLPAPYWECKAPGQISQESGRGGTGAGCSASREVPDSLLLVIRNADARAAASLELKNERFRMRGKEDLEEYVDNRHNMVMKEGGGSFNMEDAEFSERDGMIVHKTVYTASQDRGDQKYVLVDYFVRPEGGEARVYQLACIGTPEAYERLRDDFETITGSFRYTGPLADSFFTPDASAEELPSMEETEGSSDRCGGGYSGMIIAMAVVFLLYMFFRHRSG